MTARCILIVFIAAAVLSVATPAQVSPPTNQGTLPMRDSQAIAALQSALIALGGAASVGRIQDTLATGTLTSDADSSPFTFKNSGPEFRYDYTRSNGGTDSYASGHGKPRAVVNGRAILLFNHVGNANFPPHLVAFMLLTKLNDQHLSIRFGGTTTVSNKLVFIVRLSSSLDRVSDVLNAETWYLDAATGLPVRIDISSPTIGNVIDTITIQASFADFRVVDGVLVPYQAVLRDENGSTLTYTFSSVAFNAGIPSTDFDLVW